MTADPPTAHPDPTPSLPTPAGSAIGPLLARLETRGCPLGPSSGWPQALRSAYANALHSPLPIALVWGERYTTLYNDAYIALLGDRHPHAFGQAFDAIWHDYRDKVMPLLDAAYGGRWSHFEDVPYVVRRDGVDAEAWVNYTCTPLFDEEGAVRGMLATCTDSTAKVLLARAAAQEAQAVHDMLEQAPGLVVVLEGPQHIVRFTNRAYRDFIGGRDIAGLPIKEALPDIAAQGFGALVDQVYASGEPYVGTEVPAEVQVWPGGAIEKRWFDFTYQPLRDAQGRVTGIFTEGIDVSARVRKTQAEGEVKRRLVQLVDGLPQLAWIADSAGRAVWFNERFQDYTGLDQEALLARDWQGLLPDGQRAVVDARWREALEGGHPFVATVRLRRAGGELRAFFATAVPVAGSGGAIEQWFGTCTDVSSLQETQEALRLTQEWLELGLSTGKMVVWDYRPDTGQIRYSENAGELLGYAHDDIENSFRHVHPDDVPGVRAAIRRTMEEGGRYHYTSRRIHPVTGQVKWVEQRGRVVSKPGEPVRMVGVNIDVTERVLAENQLQEANRRKDEFLAMLAHELRNPLAPLSAAAHLLQQQGMGPAQIGRTSDIIARQVGHMTKLLDDLLDVSRVTRGLVTLQLQAVDLKQVVASAIEQAQPLIDARRHRLAVDIAPGAAIVLGDQVRLVQVLTNLLNNACRYTPPGGQLGIALTADGDEVAVSVADNGVGIDEAFLPEIFDLFTQGERSADRSQGGLGLGLALVKTMVELHHGRITAASGGRGQGSTFELRLPRLVQDEVDRTAGTAAGKAAGRSLNIAIVDDNADAANLIGVALEMEGHRVITFYDPLRFIDDARIGKCDAFVLDIGLPGMDGYELARRLRRRPELAGALIIALSGYGQEADVQRAEAAGFDVHLTKPVSLEVLLQQLGRVAGDPAH